MLVFTYATNPLCHALDVSDINMAVAYIKQPKLLMCIEISLFVLCQMIKNLAIL